MSVAPPGHMEHKGTQAGSGKVRSGLKQGDGFSSTPIRCTSVIGIVSHAPLGHASQEDDRSSYEVFSTAASNGCGPDLLGTW
ncbi:hypothetical protein [Xylella fastidiosa]|nr:hypothetical protein [Xylella fastidiosa]UIX82446.1 hypothetical protein LZ756_06280 [Xylella fastidiosa subsp. sandyi]